MFESFAAERSLLPVLVWNLPRMVDPWALAVFWTFQVFDVAWNEILEVTIPRFSYIVRLIRKEMLHTGNERYFQVPCNLLERGRSSSR